MRNDEPHYLTTVTQVNCNK